MRRLSCLGAAALGLLLLTSASVRSAPVKKGGGKSSGGKSGGKPGAGEMPKLRTGARALEEAKAPLALTVVRASTDATEQLLELSEVASPDGKQNLPFEGGPGRLVEVRSTGGQRALATLDGAGVIHVRRPVADATRGLEGELYLPLDRQHRQAVVHHRFSVAAPMETKRDEAVRVSFAESLVALFEDRRGSSPFYAFAADRLRRRYLPPAPPAEESMRRRRPDAGELRSLMDTTTGMTSIQESIQADRPLFLAAARQKASVPFSSVKPPQLAVHPFDKMLARLPTGAVAIDEPLADATPAEFYYLRVRDLNLLFRIVDQLDAWATPAINVLDRQNEDRALAERTLAQLGLDRGPLARALGTQVVGELAIVGSDPYFREGTDVTVIFQVKQRALFDMALSGTMSQLLAVHGTAPATRSVVGGTEITRRGSLDGQVRQHRASAGDLEIVSNSLAATRRVLDAIARRSPRLSDEKDWRYMGARAGAGHPDGLAFLSDRFIAEVVGPRQKILEARRQLALAELLAPGYAALLHGWFEGRAPASTAELLASGWLKADELRHADGTAIAFSPGSGARSSLGSPGALEPLYDQPAPTLVTPSERDGYAAFAQSYQRYWREFIDPVHVRFSLDRLAGGKSQLTADVRVLPLIDGTDYRKIEEMVGQARITTPELASGLRAVFGIGQDARLRRELSSMADHSPFGAKFLFDWLGDWLFFGVEDRVELAHTVAAFEPHKLPQPPETYEERSVRRQSEWRIALQTPAYLAIAVSNPVGAALFMTGVRKLTMDSAKDYIQWGEGKAHKGVSLVRIGLRAPNEPKGESTGALYYAITDDALLFALTEGTLHRLIDERAGGKGTASAKGAAPQFALQWSSSPGAPLSELLGWMLEVEAVHGLERARQRAEVLLRGAPGAPLRGIGLAYEGAEPIPSDGGHFTLGPDGARDEARGSNLIERWPSLPVPGSPVARLLAALARFSAEMSFDEEPRVEGAPIMRSLHVRARMSVTD